MPTDDLFANDLRRSLEQAVAAVQSVEIAPYRDALARIDELLFSGFRTGVTADELVQSRAACVDNLLIRAWQHFVGEMGRDLALVAAGGYGRRELLPHSDIDLLVLYRDGRLQAARSALERFVTFAWDIGLAVGHSVRSLADCADIAATDVTVMTNLLEARPLSGAHDLFDALCERLLPTHLWSASEFFQAKLEEQQQRHLHFDDTAYKLEPNIKESPGGLRDIQTIAWVAKRHFDAETFEDLAVHGFLSGRELNDLRSGRSFLWRVRFALHTLAERREDRLLFDYQVQVAQLFGYRDANNNLAVEQFMQIYYRHIKALSALNDVLLQLFSEAILLRNDTAPPRPINSRFRARHGFIEASDDNVFCRNPRALLEIFHLMQTRPDLAGIRAETLRLIRRDRHCIDPGFRADVRCRRLFLDILRAPTGVVTALRRMNRYGVLGRYLPAFGFSIGRMQYDLFHTLTVDEHSLFVVRNLRRLRLPRFEHELPFASRIMQAVERPELLYIAALFHDSAKGREGDHSMLGAEDAGRFCRSHGLSSRDSDLVCWLVRQHLLMSMTAQRKDINDPNVVHDFAAEVADHSRLDQLFVFTVSDIRATNPNLWNSWKEALLIGLYQNTARALARGLEYPLKQSELVADTRAEAARQIPANLDQKQLNMLWQRFDDDYFLRHSAAEIAWHAEAIIAHQQSGAALPLVRVEDMPARGTTVFVYTGDRDHLFGLTTGKLAQLGLSILDARITTTGDGYTVDSYAISESSGDAVLPGHRHREIRDALSAVIADPAISRIRVTRRPSRRSRAFSVPTQVYFSADTAAHRTVMELITADRPGLLSTVGEVFRKRGILLQTAKIATIGERAEDVFFITDRNHNPLSDPALFRHLRQLLTRILDRLQREDISP